MRGVIAWIGHVVSAGAGGACLGGLTAWAGGWLLVWLLPDAGVRYLVAAAVTGLYMLRELGVLPLPVVDLKTAVPATWRNRWGWEAASWMYGFALGWGFTARTPYSNFHLMLLWVASLADPVWGAVAGMVYGVSRALPPMLLALAGRATEEQTDALLANKKAVHALNGWTNGLVAAVYMIGLLLA